MPTIMPPGTTVDDRYLIESPLGRGGMGVVYKAMDTRLHRPVALKTILPDRADDAGSVSRFEAEASAVAQLNHPNIVQIYDFQRFDGQFYMVTQFLEGETLAERLGALKAEGRPMPFGEAVRVALDIAAGLAHAHAHKVLHRDIKPSNVMLCAGGPAIIMDFGVAKIVSETVQSVTQSLLGTPLYMSPEQARGDGATARSDIYSLGIVLFEMCAGRCPFIGENLMSVLQMHCNAAPPDLRELRPGVPASLTGVIEAALAKSPGERFQTAEQFIDALSKVWPDAEPEEPGAYDETVTLPASEELTTVVVQSPLPPMPAAEPDSLVTRPADVREIRYDPDSWWDGLSGILDGFVESLRDEQFQAVVGRDTVRQLSQGAKEVVGRRDKEFTLLVIGDFNRGKSTLINALLGAEVVTTDVLTETVTINEICYGAELKIEGHLPGGGRFPLTPDELKSERLHRILARLPQKPLHLSIEAPAEWLRGVKLVDTPGLGDLFRRFDEQVKSYLPQADAVLFVVTALAPLSESERAFLETALRPYDFPKLCFVVNMLDLIGGPTERARVLEAAEAKLARLFPDAVVFGVSALDELGRQQGQPPARPELAEGLSRAFEGLREHISTSVLMNRDLIRLERATSDALGLLAGCESVVRRMDAALDADLDNLEAVIRQCEDENSALHLRAAEQKTETRARLLGLSEETSRWMAGFIRRLETEVIGSLNDFKYEELKKHFPFFLADVLRDAWTGCLDAHYPVVMECLQQAQTQPATSAAGQGLPVELADLDLVAAGASHEAIGWTTLDNLHVALHFTSFGGVLGQLLVGLTEQQLAAGLKVSAYRDHLLEALPRLRAAVDKEVRARYVTIADTVEKVLETSLQERLGQALSTLRQARQIQQSGEQRTAAVREALGELGRTLAQVGDSLNQFRERLRSTERVIVIDALDSIGG